MRERVDNRHYEDDSGHADLRMVAISMDHVVTPRVLPRTDGTAPSCHHDVSGDTAWGRGQAMLINSNSD
jgi:hypothetical protein